MPSIYYALRHFNAGLKTYLFTVCPLLYKRKIMRDIEAIKNNAEAADKIQLRDTPAVVIEQSNLCNLNCVMCRTNESKRQKQEMPKDLLEKIVAQKVKWGQRLLTIHTVGEPFMCSYLEDLFNICSKHNVCLNITTNGLLIPKHMDLIRRYPGIIRFMAFSVDGATKETYERIRRGGSFEKLIESLDLIKDYNRKSPEKISINLQACISKENFKEIPLFFRTFGKYFRPDEIFFIFVTDLSAMHADSAYYRTNMPIDIKFYRRNWPCRLLWGQTHILSDGRVSACCRDYNGELIVGEANKSSLSDIWHSEEYEILRRRHIAGDIEDIPLCRDCHTVDNSFLYLFNDYARYLFLKYKNGTDGQYMEKLNAFLRLMSGLRDTKDLNKKDLEALFV
jgi:MoaA/NifB/PqqE/SkfB family radical SAM enzyme